jgi:predicted HTH transcriptional regulator
LNDRDTLDQHELRQLNLLFGLPKVVSTELRRDLMDLRIIDEQSGRPTQRELLEADNLLTALGKAVKFLSRDLDLDGGDTVDLTKTEGSFDYIATRELLVNQIVHQDYQDRSAPSQIEIFETKVSVFNAGYSLLEMPEVLEGGKSQSRNPLIARALRLAGFAEISGSGIRALQRACLKAKRPAPEIKSDRQNNTFTLVIRWGEMEDEINSYWRSLLGVSLSQEQAEILEVIKSNPSITLPAIESQTGYDTEVVVSAIEFLTLQVLIVSDNANYRLADHLLDQLS